MATTGTTLRDTLLPHASHLQKSLTPLSSPSPPTFLPALTNFCQTLDYYLQLPTLLDPLIPTLLPPLLTLARTRLTSFKTTPSTGHDARQLVETPFIALYTLFKVRGTKSIAKHLPHQVSDLHFLVAHTNFIESYHKVHRFWHIRHVLFHWLSVAIRIPFPLDTVLQQNDLGELVTHAERALSDHGPVAAAAATFLSRLLARRDAEEYRHKLLGTAERRLMKESKSLQPALLLLAGTFKLANRDDLRMFVRPTLKRLMPLLEGEGETVTMHYAVKLAARIALAVLPPRLAAWRYERGTRIVFAKLDGKVRRKGVEGHVGKVEEEEEGLEEGVEEVVEEVVEVLLGGLESRETVVRWSAAKGIGRVTGRLPKDMGRDVVGGVLELFEGGLESRMDAGWHGGCLAVAELARRGLILGEEMENVWDKVYKACRFEIRRGGSATGGFVRDAACYVVWAVARAYGKEEVGKWGEKIAASVLPVACLDREVNCRRAAAAAFQECVGRLGEGVFGNGIAVVGVADYFGVGERERAFLEVMLKVAKLGYAECLEREVVRKISHWDGGVRELAAKGLVELVKVDEAVVGRVLKDVVEMSTKRGEFGIRHGGVLAVAELARVAEWGELAERVRGIVRTLKEGKMLIGKTGDEMRVACCGLLRNLAMFSPTVYEEGREEVEFALEFLEGILGCGKEHMYKPAAGAYAALCEHVVAKDVEWHVKVTRRVLKGIEGGRFVERQRGYALAAGVCGKSQVREEVVQALCQAVGKSADVEVRRNAALSLAKVGGDVGVVLRALRVGMDDYAVDERGDVGSWVREASMTAAAGVVGRIDGGDGEVVRMIVDGIVKQCCGRIDRTRLVAGRALKRVCEHVVSHVQGDVVGVCKQVMECFELDKVERFQETEWVFEVVKRALEVEDVRNAVLFGMIAAGGGMGHQSRPARRALLEYFKTCDAERKFVLLRETVRLLEMEDRMTVPAMNVLKTLAADSGLDDVAEAELIRIVKVVRAGWRGRLRDVKRTAAGVGLLGELAMLSVIDYVFVFEEGSLGRECVEALGVVLGGGVPRLRRIAADCLYLMLVEFEEGKWGEAVNILGGEGWESGGVVEARRKRDLVCRLLGVRTPVLVSK